jgi:hypothetical protein
MVDNNAVQPGRPTSHPQRLHENSKRPPRIRRAVSPPPGSGPASPAPAPAAEPPPASASAAAATVRAPAASD